MPTEQIIEIQTAKWSPDDQPESVISFLKRPAFDPKAEEKARSILNAVRQEGDEAVIRFAREHDSCQLAAGSMPVSQKEMNEARGKVENSFIIAAREVHKRVLAFAKAGMKKTWTISSPKGGTLGEQFTPFERVGVYIPGGQAPLVSTALMTVTRAKAAGVPEIAACSPVDASAQMNPYLLVALEIAGTTEIYKIGGIQAIGAFAYGTKTIKKVQKIVGPGGQYVTAAKRLVYGEVALDLVAGPSEIAILADDSAAPEAVAADLLSQAEHGTGFEKVLLVTPSERLAVAVRGEMLKQIKDLSRQAAISNVLNRGALLVTVNNLDTGMELCNRFAPEHLEIIVQEPRNWLKKVRNAGAVFVGGWSPECAGDYAAGPSHVLPTGGTAAMFSGLTVDDFLKRTSVIAFTRADLLNSLDIIKTIGNVEGMDAHVRSALIRFNKS
ncbi:MAG: histidinol dehydrogenase [Kiritimatiellia bacterium]|nr:histidinol dehydrogenase [Kiritimatiellia bacterium]